jgi:hypothetical protein
MRETPTKRRKPSARAVAPLVTALALCRRRRLRISHGPRNYRKVGRSKKGNERKVGDVLVERTDRGFGLVEKTCTKLDFATVHSL